MAFRALDAPPKLDEAEALERVRRYPGDFDNPADRFYATDHPKLFHWVNHAILSALNVEIGEVPKVNGDKDYFWHIRNNQIAPRRPVMILRWANVVALAGSFVCLYLLARLVCGGHLWGFVLVIPLAFSRRLAEDVGGYIMTDAYLAFFLSLSLLLWVRFHLDGSPLRFRRVLAMGVVMGLAVSTKLNAGLVLLAYCTYLAIVSRRADRVLIPALVCLISFAVFVIINPVMQHGGVSGLIAVLHEILEKRAFTYRMHDIRLGPKSAVFMFLFMFPQWYLLPVFGVVIAAARKERWFLPVFLWTAFLICGTALTIRQPFERYLMPIQYGFTVSVLLSAIMLAHKRSRGALTLSGILRP